VENIEYHADRNLNRDQILQLATGKYIKSKNNIIIMGASGAGKSYFGCAFGVSACRQFKKTKYIRLSTTPTAILIVTKSYSLLLENTSKVKTT